MTRIQTAAAFSPLLFSPAALTRLRRPLPPPSQLPPSRLPQHPLKQHLLRLRPPLLTPLPHPLQLTPQ